MGKPKNKVKNLLINLSILLVVIMFCFGVAEVGFRLFRSNEVTPGYWPSENAVYIPEMKRNVYVNLNNLIRSTSEYSYSISTNELGFRDFHDFEKPPNTKRIVGLGSSFLFGNTVEAEENYLSQLGKELQVETINLGLGGIGFNEMNFILTEYGLKYEPDLVIMDAELGSFYSSYYFTKKGTFSEGKTPLYLSMYQNSKVVNYFYWKTKTSTLGFKLINFLKLNKHGQASNSFGLDFLQNKDLPEIYNSKKNVYKNLKEIKEVLDERSIPLVMVYITPSYQADPKKLKEISLEYNVPEESLDVQVAKKFYSAAAKQLNIPIFDASEELVDYSKNKDLSWKYDNHFNKEGNIFFASLLADFIKENNLMET